MGFDPRRRGRGGGALQGGGTVKRAGPKGWGLGLPRPAELGVGG